MPLQQIRWCHQIHEKAIEFMRFHFILIIWFQHYRPSKNLHWIEDTNSRRLPLLTRLTPLGHTNKFTFRFVKQCDNAFYMQWTHRNYWLKIEIFGCDEIVVNQTTWLLTKEYTQELVKSIYMCWCNLTTTTVVACSKTKRKTRPLNIRLTDQNHQFEARSLKSGRCPFRKWTSHTLIRPYMFQSFERITKNVPFFGVVMVAQRNVSIEWNFSERMYVDLPCAQYVHK